MFRCERCGSSYSGKHTIGIENCPRCKARDRIASPLTFKAFQLPASQRPAATSLTAQR
jgi:rubrerythrin